MASNTKSKAVEAEVTEAQVESTEAESTEAVIDLTEFKAAVTEAVSNSDESTGTVPETNVEAVRSIYQGLDGIKAKNAAKAYLQEQLRTQLDEMNMPGAKAIMLLTEHAAVAGKSSSPAARKPVDPTEGFVASVTQLTLALYLAQSDVPEGVDGEAAVASAQEAANELFAEAQAVYSSEDGATENPLIRGAIKLATSKVRKTSATNRNVTGERRDLGGHIEEAFASVESGTFLTVAEIRKFESSQYGSDHPSAGAISNRLEPKSGKPTSVPGITVERRDGKLGAVKN